MQRPYMICHMLSALDGRITGEFMRTEKSGAAAGEYARIRREYDADAWLCGAVTTKEFTAGTEPVLVEGEDVPKGDHVVDSDAGFYYVSVDPAGEIGWESGVFRKAGRPDGRRKIASLVRNPFRFDLRRRHGKLVIPAGRCDR